LVLLTFTSFSSLKHRNGRDIYTMITIFFLIVTLLLRIVGLATDLDEEEGANISVDQI
jgi:hypothetical protein